MASNEKQARPAKQTVRRSEPEFRAHLLDTAVGMIRHAGGLTVDVGELNFEDVIKEAGVARSTAYRYWPHKDAFYRDVLCELASASSRCGAPFDPTTVALARGVIATRTHDLFTPESRWLLLRETVRVVVAHNFAVVAASLEWRTYVTLKAALISLPEQAALAPRLRTALEVTEQGYLARITTTYEDVTRVLGFRLRNPERGYRALALAGAAIIEGFALGQIASSEPLDTPLTVSGPTGEPEEWTLPALTFYGALNALLEPDEDYDASAALARFRDSLGHSA